jgi:hypothetical protein
MIVKGITTRSAYRECGPGAGAYFNDFSHGFMTHDVPGLHSRHEVVEEM